MGTNTGIGIGIGIPFKNNVLGEGKPYLPPEIKDSLKAVVIAYGKTNNDSDRAIVKNLVDASNPFVISNAAFKLNSGFGKYEVDFTEYRSGNLIYVSRILPNSILATTDGSGEKALLAKFPSNENDDINDYKVEIKLTEGVQVVYKYIDNTGTLKRKYLNTSGIYDLPKSYISKLPSEFNDSIGFSASGVGEIYLSQIPSFEGAFVTDGVNDLITSTKTVQEMGITDEITVVSMIHQIDLNSTYTIATTNYIENSNSKEHVRSDVYNYGKTGIYGYSASLINNTKSDIKNILGDEADYYVKSTNSLQTIFDAKFSVVGRISELTEASQVAWYWTIIANKVLTTDEINQVIAYFNLDKTLKPDILCNITKQGITNDNHADFNDKLIDYSGNGRDIQMYNLAWKGGSGIAAKKFETIKDYNIIPDEGLQELTIYNEFSFKIKSIRYADRYWAVQSLNKTDMSYPVTIITDKDIIWRNTLNYTDADGVKGNVKKETNVPANTPTQVFIYGFNDFDISDDYTKVNCVAYATRKDITEFTVTFIPSCKGGLLLDGVNDFGKVTGIPVYKDYTVIADYIRISAKENAQNSPILSKSKVIGSGAFLFNYLNADSVTTSVSFGTHNALKEINDFERKIYYLSKYASDGYNVNAGSAVDYDTMWLGAYRDNAQNFFNGAIYSLMTFPYSMSEFLIERQLKKHKLGTLYPDMVEFRPVIKANNDYEIVYTAIIKPNNWQEISIGDYVTVGKSVAIQIKLNNPLEVTNVSSNSLADVSFYKEETGDNVYTIYGRLLDGKSPQKISLTIEQDENYVQWNPVVTSNVEYIKLDFYLNNYQKRINIGDYIPKDAYLRANFYLKNNVDELTVFTFNGVNIGYRRSSVDDTAFNINQIYNYDSPQEVNITVDEYIRYEDIVQPYPVLLRFNDESGKEVSWGGKFKVGSTITRIGSIADPESNLLNGLYSISGLSLNGKAVTSSTSIVEKQMVFRTTATYLFDNNEPKCILSPSRLRIPNSSYKILGYIPDISGHGNHGKINNSAYAEGSGVNEDGSYQFDGVDDFVTIPTLSSGGKQVLMKVNWNTIDSIIYDQRGSGGFAIYCSDYNNPSDSITVPAYKGRNAAGTTYIDGIRNEYIIASQLRNVTHNIVEILDTSYAAGKTNPIIGKSHMNSNYGNLALYDFMLFDNISTDDKIKELNEYVGIEAKVELPSYYWDNYGKTNLDEDRDIIQQRGIAVGDYDLTNYNHAYEGMSGYNGYPVVFGANKTWANESNGYVTSITSNTIHITNVLNAGLALLYSYVKYNGNLQNIKEIPPFKIEIKGLEGRSKFIYKYLATSDATKETNLYLGNGTHELPKSFLPTEALINNAVVGFSISPIEEGVTNFLSDITIEVLPEYSNGLVYDGITDYSKNANISALDDFTAIIKREWLKKQGSPLIKGSKVYEGGNGNALLLEWDKAYNFVFYKRTDIMEGELPDNISFITPTNYNGNVITRGSEQDTNGICIAGDGNAGFANMVFYKLILYPKTIPLLQINFLKNLMERDEIIDLTNPIFIQE